MVSVVTVSTFCTVAANSKELWLDEKSHAGETPAQPEHAYQYQQVGIDHLHQWKATIAVNSTNMKRGACIPVRAPSCGGVVGLQACMVQQFSFTT